jgi:hypothetical protein
MEISAIDFPLIPCVSVKAFLEIPSCILVFKVIPQDATFEMQIFNLGLKTKAISKGKFPLDFP